MALLALALALTREFQAWAAPRVQRTPRLSRRAAGEATEPELEEPQAPPSRQGGLQSSMRSKLMEEARSMGDEETPVSWGFGNPYLLGIVVILVLGVASYFQLGLDKVNSVKPGDVSAMASQEKEGQSRLKKLQKVIKDAFACFDQQQKWQIEPDEVGAVMRYLGQFPSESDLKETIIPELQEEDRSKDGLVSFEAFERLMLRCLSEHTYDPDDSETLLAAFRVLDPQGLGYIDSNLMHEWLSTKGGKAMDFFKERETSDFLEYAKDKDSSDSSRIYYEDCVAKLNDDIEKHLESLYQAARGSSSQ
ncbi:unnamed protein product [Effrenium voratum]|nr:unnamed protein product [Effrenium voratum]